MTFVLALAVCSLWGWGAEIVVSLNGEGAFTSIQRALDAANYGDIIRINPGIYEETLILKSGVTLSGAGRASTVIRSSYGYDPVIRGRIVGAVTLSNLTIERTATLLAAPVIDLESSDVVFDNCIIRGGQAGGLRSIGTARLEMIDCTITDNADFGVQVSDGGRLELFRSTLQQNDGPGLHLAQAVAQASDGSMEWNETHGVLMETGSTFSGQDLTIANNGRWGIECGGTSSFELSRTELSTQALGNVLLEDHAQASFDRCDLSGGQRAGIEARADSSIDLLRSSVLSAAGDGLLLSDHAALSMNYGTLAHCQGTGVSATTEGVVAIVRSTLSSNGGDGLFFKGSEITVSHSQITLNAGIGLNIQLTHLVGSTQDFSYNNVWGNRAGEFSGINPSSSDSSMAPEYAAPENGDFSLLLDSPFSTAGQYGTPIGAAANPQWERGARGSLGFTRHETPLGDWEASVDWMGERSQPPQGTVRWGLDGEGVQAGILSQWIWLSHQRTKLTIAYAPSQPRESRPGALHPSLGIRGVLDGDASRWSAWGDLSIVGRASVLRVATSYELPTGRSIQRLALDFRNLSLSADATGFLLNDLAIGWAQEFDHPRFALSLSASLDLIPQSRAVLRARWPFQEGTASLQAETYLEQWTTSSFRFDWTDSSTLDLSLALALREGRFDDLEIESRIRARGWTLSGLVGTHALEGPRLRITLTLATSSWFLPRPNQPPLPALSIRPSEPEAGELIYFDASESLDPDGMIDQIWWEFGDGGVAIGERVQHTYADPGQYSLTLLISDDNGDVTSHVSTIRIVERRSTPAASFIWAAASADGARLPHPARAGDYVLLDASESYDPDGSIFEYGWDFDSDGVFDRTTVEPRVLREPFSAGSWPITLRVVDDAGHADSIMRVVLIEERKPPEAVFELSPTNPAVADPIRISDASIPRDHPIVAWSWDFGDGGTSDLREPTHRFMDSGIYTVQLTVRDAFGLESTFSRQITVAENPELVAIQNVWLLAIGISNYAEVEDLSYADRDARAMLEWWISNGVNPENARWLTDRKTSLALEGGATLSSQLATLVNVRAALGWLRQNARRNDLVIIHFSGHGYQGVDDNSDERDGVDEFFVLYDTAAEAKDDTALRDDEFGRFLDRIESQHVLVFFDSCYSGGLSRSLTPGSRTTSDDIDVFSDFQLEGRLILSASSENQDAFESPQLEHGVLTHFLLEGLNGHADLNTDAHVTVWELFEYVRAEVSTFVKNERGEVQTPQLMGEGESRVVLLRTQPEASDRD